MHFKHVIWSDMLSYTFMKESTCESLILLLNIDALIFSSIVTPFY